MFGTIDPGDESSIEKFREHTAPMLDTQIRQAIQMLWFALPPERRNIAEVEKEFRRLADRALQNLREDAASFDLPGR